MKKITFIILTSLFLASCGNDKLPDCPSDTSYETWNSCFGVLSFTDGTNYTGEWKDGKGHGQGTLTFSSGDQYMGKWKDGKRHGQGAYTFINGDNYVGEFKDNKMHGQGTLIWSYGNVLVKEWKSSAGKYVGEFKNDKFNGQGTVTFTEHTNGYSRGTRYIGEFKENKFNGQGTITFADGSKHVGEFKDGEIYRPFADITTYICEHDYSSLNNEKMHYFIDGKKKLLKNATWAIEVDDEASLINIYRWGDSHGYPVLKTKYKQTKNKNVIEWWNANTSKADHVPRDGGDREFLDIKKLEYSRYSSWSSLESFYLCEKDLKN